MTFMKTTIKNIVALAALVLTLAACTSEEKDLFGQSAAQRLNESVASYQALLAGSQYGWAMEFFPSAGQYGGYVLTARFQNGDVDMTSEMDFNSSSAGSAVPAGTVVSSKYSVKAEQSVILTFDTYNRLIHFFSQPNGSNDPDGYESDYEFVFMRASADGDSIFLRGKKYENELVMVRLRESGTDYIHDIKSLDAKIGYAPYSQLTVGGTTYDLDLSGNVFSVTDADGNTQALPFVLNAQGLRIYEPMDLGGYSLSSLVYDDATGALRSTDGMAVASLPDGVGQIIHARYPWVFQANQTQGDMSADLLAKFQTVAKLRKAPAVFDYACLTTPSRPADVQKGFERILSFQWSVTTAFGTSYAWLNNGVALSQSATDPDVINVEDAGAGYGYTTSYMLKASPFFDALFGGSPYKVTFNEGGLKTEARFVSVADPSLWFTMKFNTAIE